MARPKKEIDWDDVIKRMEAGNTAEQIYEAYFIDKDTFYRRFKEEFECSFGDYKAKFHECGKGNIVYTQYLKALEGNANMLTLLGKEWCGQGKDQVTQSPYQIAIDMNHENMMLKARIAELEEQFTSQQPKTEQELQPSDPSV